MPLTFLGLKRLTGKSLDEMLICLEFLPVLVLLLHSLVGGAAVRQGLDLELGFTAAREHVALVSLVYLAHGLYLADLPSGLYVQWVLLHDLLSQGDWLMQTAAK